MCAQGHVQKGVMTTKILEDVSLNSIQTYKDKYEKLVLKEKY